MINNFHSNFFYFEGQRIRAGMRQMEIKTVLGFSSVFKTTPKQHKLKRKRQTTPQL